MNIGEHLFYLVFTTCIDFEQTWVLQTESCPSKIHVGTLTPNTIVFGNGVFRVAVKIKWDHRTCVPVRKGRSHQSSVSPPKHRGYVRTQWENSHLQPRERGLTGNQLCWHLDPRFLVPTTVRKCLLVKPPSLWYFILEAQVVSYSGGKQSSTLNIV